MSRDDARRRRHRASSRVVSTTVYSKAAACFIVALFAVIARAQRLPTYVQPPYLQSISPDTGHVVGGTTVTIYGGGFQNHAGLAARFAYYDSNTGTAEVDVVRATYVDYGTIRVVTPPRKFAASVHVTVTNNGIGYSTTPLNTDDAGTYALFEYKSNAPAGSWTVKNATGHAFGGAVVEITNPSHTTSTRSTDNNFLPGVHLRCRFGNPSDASATTNLTIGTATKTAEHPWFGRGGNIGYTVTSNRLNGGSAMEGPSFILRRGTTYTFTVSSTGHPFYLSSVEPSMWEKSNTPTATLTTATDSGSVTFAPDSNTPDYVFYHSTSGAFMGGMITVVDSGAADFETGAANANTVRAEWVSYNKIRCIAPTSVSALDDNADHGGNQVTIFVSNDGVSYHSGQGGADSATPTDAGTGSTFTYFGNTAFTDVPLYFLGSGASYSGGVALELTSSKHAMSTIYAQDGTKDGAASTAYASASTSHATEASLVVGSGNADDLVVEGTFTGNGIAWFEIVIDDATSGAETFRWRLHAGVGSNVAWVETARAIPVGVFGGTISPSGLLSDGISIRFTSSGGHHLLGDRWIVRVYGGNPNVISARTTHEETTYAARGPFFGNTEITIIGESFFPSNGMWCKLYDSDTTVTHTVPAYFDNMKRVRCITEKHEPRSGGEVPGTFRPCFYKNIQLSLDDKSTFSVVKSDVKFLYCDIYVSKSGSDAYGDGTPNAPYLTLQRSIEAALGEARSYDIRYNLDDPDTGIRLPSEHRNVKFGTASKIPVNNGFGYFVNRDKVRVKTGTYAGAGNVGLHPLGKMLEAEAKDGAVTIECGAEGYTGMLVNGDRHGTEEVTNSGSVSFFGITHVNC